ncbi:manganese catalase family protein [Microbispora catharanthi]|uniref:Uncharacterized protein n=1 Tax=Microbispora catharanthi TaxID=1712871 RepID=A0A5N6BN36_9ACTN|nr:manganese catalase family protein [Microbispora catharanthi]KAB8181473.1 hypothetical protein FH610_029145 [Microbispora catharanthi]
MFRHNRRSQFEAKPEKPGPVYARELQELIGGAFGEIVVVPDALFDEEHAETIWDLSDGAEAQSGGWASGPQPDGRHRFAAPRPAWWGTRRAARQISRL